MGKIIVGKKSDLLPGSMQKVAVDGRDILVANIDGNYYACDDTCTHAGASLADGVLEGGTITCGWHGAKFNCMTGKLEKFPAKIRDLKSYQIVVESDSVFVEV
ncbi:Rieske (2Fe-2S) protein [Candidatus Nitrosotenuis sp. DW1]|uniref:Rieske (2Fe-2S) protein n=1 Tax=Candidatus Nitrosotenuis sp. DW1 TaxID=2259672 RepID=UPI0015CEEB3D|nr:non-heme iron oxygenase ferredoxin subunit [Candidatus Nitrosotenuis sp. DW1]QLH08365.1 non-heme iron oxygenase ferredoxin subunit [Candidatus Nitrosotenuis sp. DW1]